MNLKDGIIDNRNPRTENYIIEREEKDHERELISLISRDFDEFQGDLLDIGCAAGSTLSLLRDAFPNSGLHGVDISDELVELGKRRLGEKNIHLDVGKLPDYTPRQQYDVVCAQGILSVFQEPLDLLDQWTSWLRPEGRLYVFGRFNSNPMDVRVIHRNRHDDHGWETGYTNYSTLSVSEHLREKGFEVEFIRFKPSRDIPKRAEPNRSYTLELANGERILVNGANIVVEQFFLIVSRA